MNDVKNISRSDFIKGGAVGLLGLAGMSALSGCAQSQAAPEKPAESNNADTGAQVSAPARIIDVHAHLLPGTMNTDYVAWLQETKTMEDGPFFLWTDSAFEDVQNHLSEMDRFGIDKEVVTFSSNVPNIVKATRLEEKVAISALNDGLQEISNASDGRIISCAWIDPNAGDDALAEMNRVAENGAKAFGMLTGYVVDGKGHYMDYPAYEPFWAEASKLGLPVFTHFSTRLSINDPDSPLTGFSTENVMNGGVSVLVENAVSATRLVFSGVLDKHPNLRIVLGQLGGFLPWMFGRYELMHGIYSASAEKQGVDCNDPSNLDTYLRNLKDYASCFYLDSHSMSREDIACAQTLMGADHVMFGSDYPITPAPLGREQPLDGCDAFPADPAVREAFYHGNAAQLLGLDEA